MDPTPLSQIAAWSCAKLLSGPPQTLISGFSQDTRTLQPGELYIALRGEHFDGNEFIEEALAQGASGVLCDGKIPPHLPAHFGVLHVEDSFSGLRSLAAAWRQQLSLRAVAITGSNGKTSTKDFTHTLLKNFFNVTSTQGNFNNHLGLPLSILRASRSDEIAVWEIGMNHRGEIAPLVALAQPYIGIITNIGVAHIGFLGSREAIAQEKGDLVAALPQSGIAILPAADQFYAQLASRTKARIFSVGLQAGDLQAVELTPSAEGISFQVHYQGTSRSAFLPVPSLPMVSNALMALAVLLECGVPFEEAILSFSQLKTPDHRLKLYECSEVKILDDTYNANPDSMEAALSSILFLQAKRRLAVLGMMGELGAYEAQGYERVARKAAASLDVLVVVSQRALPLARSAREAGMKEVYHVLSNEEASALLLSLLAPGDLILAKGSRSARLNEVVDTLERALSTENFINKFASSAP